MGTTAAPTTTGPTTTAGSTTIASTWAQSGYCKESLEVCPVCDPQATVRHIVMNRVKRQDSGTTAPPSSGILPFRMVTLTTEATTTAGCVCICGVPPTIEHLSKTTASAEISTLSLKGLLPLKVSDDSTTTSSSNRMRDLLKSMN